MSVQRSEVGAAGALAWGHLWFPLSSSLLCSPGVMVSQVGGVVVTGEHRGVRTVVLLTVPEMLAAEWGKTGLWGAQGAA